MIFFNFDRRTPDQVMKKPCKKCNKKYFIDLTRSILLQLCEELCPTCRRKKYLECMSKDNGNEGWE